MTSIPINIRTGTIDKQEEEVIVGIDLGTTNSLVAIMDEHQKPVVLKKNGNRNLTPSVVYIDDKKIIVVGDEAKRRSQDFPERTIHSVKRLVGKTYKNIAHHLDAFPYRIVQTNQEEMVRIAIDDTYYTPIELSSFILIDLKHTAESVLQKTISKAVITVPAYYNDIQRQAVKDAGKLAGLEVLRIINEPTAAGLAYGMEAPEDKSKMIAVYDLGGGTFDMSILRITGSIFEVIATKGNTYLGGDDFDFAVANYWRDLYQMEVAISELKPFAEKAKILLTENEYFSEYFSSTHPSKYDEKTKLEIDRETFAHICKTLVDETIEICRLALKDAKLSIHEIEEIIMVGGMTRSHFIRDSVSAFFQKTVNCSVHPDEAVALGAAIQADILAGKNKDVLLLDVVPLSLGVETLGGLMDVLIPRNTTIPNRSSRVYTTQKDGQANMRISVFQGERDLVEHNRKLGEFILKGIPPMPAGLAKIEIDFFIDANGILTVKAHEQKSGTVQQVEIQPQYGLTSEKIEQLIQQSLVNAQEDITIRSQVEMIIEAQQLIKTVREFLKNNHAMLSENEKQNIDILLKQLEDAVSHSSSKNELLQSMEKLNQLVSPLSTKIMNQSLMNNINTKGTSDSLT